MKILFIIERLGVGGKERRLIELLKGLKERDEYEMELILLSDWITLDGIQNLNIPIHVLERKHKKDVSMFFRLYTFIRKSRPDIIHSWSSMTSIFAIPAVKLLGKKLINGNITNAPPDLPVFSGEFMWSKLSFLFSDVIVSNSRAGLGIYHPPETKSRCIYNGFDFKRVFELRPADQVRDEFKVCTPLVVGMVARFTPQKDYESYIQAALQILSRRKDVTFLAVGGGSELERCQAMVPPEYSGRFIFTDYQRDVESLVNIFDIGVLSTHFEGVSNSIMEYMVLKKCVVATDSGGTSELVVDDETGYLIPTGSPAVLAEKIEYLLDHPEVRKSMGAAGRKRIERDFSLAKMTSEYIKLYQELKPTNGSHP